MTYTALPTGPETDIVTQPEEGERNRDLKENLSPQEREEVRREAMRAMADDRKFWHGSDFTGGFRNARYNRHPFAEAKVEDEVIAEVIKESLRNFWGERLSSAVPLEKAETVFVSKYIKPGELINTQIVDLWNGNFRPKSEIHRLSEDEQRETVKEAFSILYEDDKAKDLLQQTAEDQDAYIDRFGNNAKEPNGVLANIKTNKYTGSVDVKMYTEEEVRGLVESLKAKMVKPESVSSISLTEGFVETPEGIIKQKTLGADLEAEFQYVEHKIIGKSGINEESTLDMIAVLRFPENIPDELLIELGQSLEAARYAVVIQKIPFSIEEVSMLAKDKIARSFPSIKNNTLIPDKNGSKYFTPRDIRIYDHLSDQKTEW